MNRIFMQSTTSIAERWGDTPLSPPPMQSTTSIAKPWGDTPLSTHLKMECIVFALTYRNYAKHKNKENNHEEHVEAPVGPPKKCLTPKTSRRHGYNWDSDAQRLERNVYVNAHDTK